MDKNARNKLEENSYPEKKFLVQKYCNGISGLAQKNSADDGLGSFLES